MSNSRREIQQIQRQEYLKCAMEPAYFMKKYCIIQHQRKGKIPFNLFDFQERVLEEFQENQYNVILKARQMGMSTLVAGYALWLMTFNTDKNVLVVALKRDVARNLLKKTKIMHENLPSFLRINRAVNNRLSMMLENGSQMSVESTTGNSGRSESLSLLIIDEAAFIKNARELWSGIQATLSASYGDAIVVSTPSNIGTWFHETWTSAISGSKLINSTENKEIWEGVGDNDFHPIKLHWSLHPERGTSWRQKQDKRLPPKKAAREYDCDFESSGDTVISMDLIRKIESTDVKPPQYKIPVNGQHDFWVWKEPKPNTSYVVSSDVARGDGDSDYSTIQVFSTYDIEQVAEYRGHVRPDELGNLLVRFGTMYNDALIVVERNSYGYSTLRTIMDREYKNLLYTSNDLHIIDTKEGVKNNKKVLPGLHTSTKTRPIIVSKLEEYLREGYGTIRSKRLCEELKTFVWKKNGKAEHVSGYHDDLIFATMFLFWARDTAIRLRQDSEKKSHSIVRNIQSKKGMQSKKGGLYTPSSPNTANRNPWTDSTTGEDLRWLID